MLSHWPSDSKWNLYLLTPLRGNLSIKGKLSPSSFQGSGDPSVVGKTPFPGEQSHCGVLRVHSRHTCREGGFQHLFSPEHSSIRSLDTQQLAPWKHCCSHQLQASWQLDAEAAWTSKPCSCALLFCQQSTKQAGETHTVNKFWGKKKYFFILLIIKALLIRGHEGNLPPQGEGAAGVQLMETGCWLTGGPQALFVCAGSNPSHVR